MSLSRHTKIQPKLGQPSEWQGNWKGHIRNSSSKKNGCKPTTFAKKNFFLKTRKQKAKQERIHKEEAEGNSTDQSGPSLHTDLADNHISGTPTLPDSPFDFSTSASDVSGWYMIIFILHSCTIPHLSVKKPDFQTRRVCLSEEMKISSTESALKPQNFPYF